MIGFDFLVWYLDRAPRGGAEKRPSPKRGGREKGAFVPYGFVLVQVQVQEAAAAEANAATDEEREAAAVKARGAAEATAEAARAVPEHHKAHG